MDKVHMYLENFLRNVNEKEWESYERNLSSVISKINEHRYRKLGYRINKTKNYNGPVKLDNELSLSYTKIFYIRRIE